jgi:hypothetical protein
VLVVLAPLLAQLVQRLVHARRAQPRAAKVLHHVLAAFARRLVDAQAPEQRALVRRRVVAAAEVLGVEVGVGVVVVVVVVVVGVVRARRRRRGVEIAVGPARGVVPQRMGLESRQHHRGAGPERGVHAHIARRKVGQDGKHGGPSDGGVCRGGGVRVAGE